MATIGELSGWRKPRRGCDDKQLHKTRGKAEAHLRALLRKGTVREAELLNVYACGDHFHVGRDRVGRKVKHEEAETSNTKEHEQCP